MVRRLSTKMIAASSTGTQWGSYTLDPGKHHEFQVPQEEMELRYSNTQGEQTRTVPGDHTYAFADVEGRLQLCNADPEETSDVQE